MSWFDLRTRSPDPNAAILRDLIQAKIDAEILAHEPEDSEHMEQGVETYSSMNIDDALSWSFLRDVTLGSSNRNYIPNEPDLNTLRLWIKNENGGHILRDHAKMGNIINIMGHKPPALVKIGDQDGLTGNRLCNIMDGNQQFDPDIIPGGQFLRISDNPNVRIKELLSTDSLTIFCRLYPISLPQKDYMVLFSKIDDEQITNAYIVLVDRAGYIYFIIRKDNKERVLKTSQPLWSTVIDKADFNPTYFQEQYFKTRPSGIYVLPKPIPFLDLIFSCRFSDMRMRIRQNGVVVADTALTPISNGLVGRWVASEGTGTTVYNKIVGAQNGTITGAAWVVVSNRPYLHFDDTSNKCISVPNYTDIQVMGGGGVTISLWYYPLSTPTSGENDFLVHKSWGSADNDRKWILYYRNSGGTVQVRGEFRMPSPGAWIGTNRTVTLTNSAWHHIVARWSGTGATVDVFTDNAKTTGAAQNGLQLETASADPLVIGDNSISSPHGYIRDVQIFNRGISDAEVTTLWTTGENYPLYDNLVAHWRLGEGGNIGTTVQEQTPSLKTVYNSATVSGATNGTITNSSWVTLPDTPHQSYLRFAANGDKILLNSYTAIQNLPEITVSLWYRHGGNMSTWRGVIWKGPVDGPCTWLIYIDTYVRFTTWNNSSARRDASLTPSPPLVAGRWYHFVGRYRLSTGEQSITIDNVKSTNNGITGTMDTGSGTQVNIGRGWTDGNFAVGEIYDVKIWNRHLSDAEVTSVYNEGIVHPSFPAWKADPPIPSESPGPITNPFQKYYDVPWNGNVAAQDTTKLHARIISGFTNFYDTNDDADIPGSLQTLPYNAIYDVQPAGGGGGGTATEVYNVAAGSGQHLEFEGGTTRGGVRFASGHAIIGQRVTDVTVRFRKLGSPGTITVGIRKNSDGTLVQLGTFNAGSFGSGEQSTTVTNASNSYAMVANDIVSVEGADNSIELTQDPSIDPNPTNTTSLGYDGSWGGEYTISMIVKAVAGAAASGGIPLLKNWNEDRAPFAPMQSVRTGEAITSTAATWGIGKKITKVVVQMTKMGSPGGTIYCRIYKAGSLTAPVQIGASKTAADIPTAQGNVTFEWATEAERAAQTYALVSGDIVGIEVVGGSISDTNYYIVHHNDTSSIANAHVKYYNNISPSTGWQWTYYSGGSSGTDTAKEMVGQFYDGGFSQTIATVFAHMKLDHQRTRAAEHFATSSAGIGKAITKITPRFKKFGNPTGSVSVVIRNSAGTQQTSFGAIDAVADIPVGDVWTPKDFTNLANVRTCAAGDRVSVEYGAGDANNYVMVSMNLNHDNFDASLSYAQEWLVTPGNIYANPGAAPGVTTYDLAGTMATGGIATDPLGRTRVGQRCNSPSSVMRGKKVTRAMIALHKVGAPPGGTYVTIRVRKEGTDAIAATIGQVLASSLATTATYYTVENVNNVYIMQQNDILTAEYDHADDTNYVVLTRTKTDIFETTGNLSQVVDYNAPTYNALTSDLFGELWTGGDTYTPAVDEQVIRDPWYHHDLLVGAGGHDWSYYAAVGTITNHVGINIMPEFRIYRRELTAAQALNLYTNRCTISNFALSQVAKVGTFGVAP